MATMTMTAAKAAPTPMLVALKEAGMTAFVVFMLWLSATHPVAFAIVLVLTLVVSVLLLIVLVKFLRMVVDRLRQFLNGGGVSPRITR